MADHKQTQADWRRRRGADAISRRQFLAAGAAGIAAAGLAPANSFGQPGGQAAGGGSGPAGRPVPQDLSLINGKIYTMDGSKRVVSRALIQNGRFAAVGNSVAAPRGVRVVDLKGRTVIPGLIEAHDHIVLVGNRPGRHVLLEDVFTLPEVVRRYQATAAGTPAGEFITTIGPIASMQFPEQRLPTLAELDAVNRPLYINAAQGGVRTNSLGRAWLEPKGVMVAADGAIANGATGATLALRLLREQFLTAESRKRNAFEALSYYAGLGITTHLDNGAFHSEAPSGGVANENTYTMHNPFLALDAEKRLPARLRFNYLHQDPPTDPALPTLSQRLRNSLPFFGNDWIRSGGIGEFTGGGIAGLRAIAAAGWRAEDHTLNLASFQGLVESREMVHAQIPITNLRWVISHVPQVNVDLVNRFKAIGGGLLVGWGPLRTGMNVGPAYRMLFDNGIHLGYHSDGGDITVINPWLNFYTMITGRNLKGDVINDQTLTRAETLWLATAANKWFIEEDDLGSIEVGNHADLAVLDRDFFTVPDEDIKRVRSILTIVGGKIVTDARVL
ncbi:MAG: amidohydrolase family protein [Acidobacteriota bacterium]